MIIYKTTNLVNNKIYVGQTKHPNKAYFGSGSYLKKALLKYGKGNFIRETIEVCLTKEELNERELFWINYFNATDRSIGYNIINRAQGIYTEKSRKSQGCKGHSEETKIKISKSLLKYKRTEEHQVVLNVALRNKTLDYITEDYRNKMSNSCSGNDNGMYGKKHSEESKLKIAEKAKGRSAWN